MLLVEEDPGDAARVQSVLERSGASFTVAAVASPAAASTALRDGAYDLILLGLPRPAGRDGGGFDAIPELAERLPVVVLAGVDDEDVAVEAVHRGAQDYLVKDRLTADLLVRSIRYARERQRLLAERTHRIEHELELAAIVQRSFLPATVPAPPGYDIGAQLRASGQVGGDFYGFLELPGDRVALAVGDASGKGIPGAILMAEAQGVLRAEAARSTAPLDLVRKLNRALLHGRGDGRFVTTSSAACWRAPAGSSRTSTPRIRAPCCCATARSRRWRRADHLDDIGNREMTRRKSSPRRARDVVQVKNPRSGRYVKIDRSAGKILSHKKSVGPSRVSP